MSYFISNKDEIADLCRSNAVYEITCPGYDKTYTGKTDHCLQKRLLEHATQPSSSAVAQHFSVYTCDFLRCGCHPGV